MARFSRGRCGLGLSGWLSWPWRASYAIAQRMSSVPRLVRGMASRHYPPAAPSVGRPSHDRAGDGPPCGPATGWSSQEGQASPACAPCAPGWWTEQQLGSTTKKERPGREEAEAWKSCAGTREESASLLAACADYRMPFAWRLCSAQMRLTWLSLHPASLAVSAMLVLFFRKSMMRACSAPFGRRPV